MYASEAGTARFARIGIPFPEMTAPFVGVVEIVCGLLLIVGLLVPPPALATLGVVGVLAAIALVAGKLIVGGIMLGVAETIFVKVRIFRVPDLLTVAFVLALFGLMVGVALR